MVIFDLKWNLRALGHDLWLMVSNHTCGIRQLCDHIYVAFAVKGLKLWQKDKEIYIILQSIKIQLLWYIIISFILGVR